MSTIVRIGGITLAVAIFWLFIAAILAFQFWPSVPQTAQGWVAFIAFGPPLYILGEAISERLHPRRRRSHRDDELGYGDATQTFSYRQIVAGVALAVAILFAVLGILWLLGKA